MTKRNDKFETIFVDGFAGGLNKSVQDSEIADDEAAELLNFKFDDQDNIKSRFGTTKVNTVTTFSKKITSIHQAHDDNILVTSAADVFERSGGTFTSRKGATTLPDDTRWSWVNFGSLTIGVNQGAPTDDTIVKWTGTGTDIVALGGSPPSENDYIEVFNDRVWVAHGTTLTGSALGDPEDWDTVNSTAVAFEVDRGDGQDITGLARHRGRLFIFKSSKTYQLITGSPNTDTSQYSIDLFNAKVGCVSHFTIQSILRDLVFLSRAGVVSLQNLEVVGDFSEALLSEKIPDLRNLDDTPDKYGSVIYGREAQYWISVPSQVNGTASTNNEVVYVLDFKKFGRSVPVSPDTAEGPDILRWSEYQGNPAGETLANVVLSDEETILIGGYNDIFELKKDGDSIPFSDDGSSYMQKLHTKQFDANIPLTRKEWGRFGISFSSSSDVLGPLTVKILLNEDGSNFHSFSINFEVGNVLRWDIGNWGEEDWAGTGSAEQNFIRRPQGDKGRHGPIFQIQFLLNQNDQGIVIKSIFINFLPKHSKLLQGI